VKKNQPPPPPVPLPRIERIKTMIPLPIHSRMKKKVFWKKLTPLPFLFAHVQWRREKKP